MLRFILLLVCLYTIVVETCVGDEKREASTTGLGYATSDKITNFKVNDYNQVLAQPVISNLIEPVKYFINHKIQLKELDNKLSIYQKAGILGISGIGKTQLARKFAYQMQDKYEIIWFFNCNLDLNEQFAELAKQINKKYKDELLGRKLSEKFTESKKQVLDFLGAKKHWLLVFDNLTVGQNNKLKDILNWENNGHIIICSQDAKDLREGIQLNYLNKDDSISLVKAIMTEPNNKIAEELEDEYKGYPLMVAQGAMFLENNKYISVAEYKKILNKSLDKTSGHISHILKQLTPSSYDLLIRAALVNNHNFTKNLLYSVTKYPNSFAEDLLAINSRFSLITTIDDNAGNPIFEMHDAIKNAVLKITGKKIARQHLIEIISNFVVLNKPGLPIYSDNISSNLQKILDNAILYKLEPITIMSINKDLMAYYMNNLLDYSNCQQLADWLITKINDASLIPNKMTNTEKAIYADYLNSIAAFYDIGKSDYLTAIEYFKKSADILSEIPNYLALKFEVYIGLAQTQIFSGDLLNGKLNLNIVDKLIKDNPSVQFDNLGLFYFVKTKLELLDGNYETALVNITQCEQEYNNLPKDSLYLATVHILKAEVLNYLQRYSEAKELAINVYQQLKNNIKGEHEIYARVLRQLARAECGLENFEIALRYTKEAKEIYMKDPYRNNHNLVESQDVDLADVLLVEGNSLFGLKKNQDALNAYLQAENIFYNVYRGNIKYIDSMSLFYYVAAKIAATDHDKNYYERFRNIHTKLFGKEHKRTHQINDL